MKHIILDLIKINNMTPFFLDTPLYTLYIIGSFLIVIILYLIVWYIFKMRSKTTHKNLITAFTFLIIPSFVFLFLGTALLARGIW